MLVSVKLSKLVDIEAKIFLKITQKQLYNVLRIN